MKTRALNFLASILCLPALAGAPVAADEFLPFRIDYEARYASFKGTVTMELMPTEVAGEFIYKNETEARGLLKLIRSGTATEQARFTIWPERIQPLTYILEGGTKSTDDDTELSFDWLNGTIASTYEGDTTELELADNVYDRMSADIAVMRALAAGKDPGPYRIAEKNQIRDYEYTFQRAEEIEVPAGRFDTVVYLRQRVGSSRSTMIWFATDHQYLPVRLEQLKRGKSQIVTVAKNLQINPF